MDGMRASFPVVLTHKYVCDEAVLALLILTIVWRQYIIIYGKKGGPSSRLGHNMEPSDFDSKIDEGFEKEMADEVIIDDDIDRIDLPATSRARE